MAIDQDTRPTGSAESLSQVAKLPVGKWCMYCVFLQPESGEFLVKIGVSSDPAMRMHALRCGLPYPPSLLVSPTLPKANAFRLESKAHRAFAGHHSYGEWFVFSPSDKDVFHKAFLSLWPSVSGKALSWTFLDAADCDRALRLAALSACSGSKRIYYKRNGSGYPVRGRLEPFTG